jgi:HlyD family secretion protein
VRFRGILTCLIIFSGQACLNNGTDSFIAASGTIEAREVNIASRVSGQLAELAVDEGSRVRPGDRLAVVDHEALEIRLRQAEAGVDLARAQLGLLHKGARREDIQQAEEARNQAEAGLKVAEDDVRRMRELAQKGSATPKQRDDAEARLIVARAQFNAAGEALKKLVEFVRPEEIQAAEARLAQARATADLLRNTIDECTIEAPVGGTVTHRAAEVGEIIAPAATILTISSLDRVYVMIYVSESDLGRIKLGAAADVGIDSYPDRTFPGRVTYISPEAEFTPKNIQTQEDRIKLVFGVKIEIDNQEGLLKPGLPADAVIRFDPPERGTK